jgi:DNA polymerase III epsilon subunit-like protein
MRQVVIAIATTGNNPKDGARISELAAIEHEDGKPTGRTLHLSFATAAASEGGTFVQQFDVLDNLIGEATIVVFNAALWRKFLRPELRHVRGRGSRRLLTQTVDVSQWARARFPRQRRDLAALARKFGVHVSPDTTGPAHDAAMLSAINGIMSAPPCKVATPMPASTNESGLPITSTVARAMQRPLIDRLATCWRVLIGQA